jgi:RimJ/RimL family protein N-acetyltransferase
MESLKGGYYWNILADEEFVGRVGFEDPCRSRTTYEICFYVAYEYWGRGIATEAVKQAVDYAFNILGIHKVHGDNDSDNPASGRVMEKAGFTNEAVFREHLFKHGEDVDIVHWVRFNERDT